MRQRLLQGELLVALGVIGLGLLLGAGTAAIPGAGGYERIGPAAYPWAIAAALIGVGGLLAWEAFNTAAPGPGPGQLRLAPPAFITLGLLLHLLLIERAGFVIASSVLFICTARAFGGRHRILTILIAVALSLIAWLAFARGLGLELPRGILGETI